MNFMGVNNFFIFITHLVVGLRDSTYTCLPLNFLMIPTKFLSVLLLCMPYQTNNFQHEASTSVCLISTFILHVDSFHNLDHLQIIQLTFTSKCPLNKEITTRVRLSQNNNYYLMLKLLCGMIFILSH